jgi:hypothetical protein
MTGMSDDRVTTGELYRVLLEIREDVKAQNGRVRKLENEAIRIKTLWSAGAIGVALFGESVKRKLGL